LPLAERIPVTERGDAGAGALEHDGEVAPIVVPAPDGAADEHDIAR
jgi:hypothetical protein